MNFMVPLTMFGWIPAVVLMFWMLPPRRAVLAAFLLAWLFLPDGPAYKIPMLPTYTKMTAATLGTLLGILFFDWPRLASFRPRWIDLPILVWCAARFGSSLANGYGVYDGLSSVEYTILVWGLPWLYGRLYFQDTEGFKDLAVAFVIGGLIYVPLCLFEIKMSPQLATWVYGIPRLDWVETKRFGGWRPTVFMQHGLMVGMWMCMSGLTAWWLWLTGTLTRVGRIPASWAAIVILVTAVLCKSFGAIGLALVGMLALWIAWKCRRSWSLWVVWIFVPLYMALRLSGAWSGAGLVGWSRALGDDDRAGSLQSRLDSEDLFIRAAWHQPLLGFRGWYNTLALQGEGNFATPDALWMIELTGAGLFGLASLTTYLLGPPARAWTKLSQTDWRSPSAMPAIVLSVVVTLSMIDNLFNGMLNPMFMLAAGALSGWPKKYSLENDSRVSGGVSIVGLDPAIGGVNEQ